MRRQDLERLSREQLIGQAERLGIPRPRVLTQPELIDEIIGRTTKNDRERAKARGWLGRARDLLARVVERGLHLPEAARVLRKDGDESKWPVPPPPLATVTLAEIYAAQGHLERAITVLDEVLAREPDHREAKSMRERFVEQQHRSRSRPPREKAPKSEAPPSTKDASSEVSDSDAAPPSSGAPSVDSNAAPAQPAIASGKASESAPPSTNASTKEPAVREPAVREPALREPPVRDAAAKPQARELPEDDDLPVTRDVPSTLEAPPRASEAASPIEPSASTDVAPLEAEAPPAVVSPPSAPPASLSREVVRGNDAARKPPAPSFKRPADPLVEPPLPDRYEIDEIVAIAVDPRTIYFYWEVRGTTLAHARARHPDGWLCVRVASVTASWEGPVVDTRDVRVDALSGDRFLRDVQPGANVRVSVGWRSGDAFEPFAVGSEVTAPRAVPVESVAHDVARWEADPVVAPFQLRPADAPVDLPAPPPPEPPPIVVEPPPPPVVEVVVEPEPPPPPPAPPPVALPVFVEPTWASAPPEGAPVDTGVTHWGSLPAEPAPPPEPRVDEDAFVEPTWIEIELGGSSELGRRRLEASLPPPPPPGPSAPPDVELANAFAHIGASDLSF